MDIRDRIINALKEGAIPTGPAVIAQISKLAMDPNASARDLGKILQLDVGLTTRILKQVNSAFYGLSSTIKTVTHAVVILGFNEVKHMALSVPVADLFEKNSKVEGIDIPALWEHSIEVACMGRALSYEIKHPVPEQVFVSGILSETGMVVLNKILGAEYARVVESCPEEDFLPQVETTEIGLSHADVGLILAKKWKFPDDLADAIRYHHDPVDGETLMTEPALLFTGRQLLALEAPEDEEDLTPFETMLAGLPELIVTTFALDAEKLRKAHARARKDFDAAKTMLSGE